MYFALHLKNQKPKKKDYIEKNDNRVKVDSNTDIADAVLEIKDKWPTLAADFSGVKLEWESEGKQKAMDLVNKL